MSDTIIKHPTEHTIEPVQDVDTSVNQVAQNAQTNSYTGVTANAMDQDGDDVTYRLVDTLNGLLKIDSDTGEIFLDNVAQLGSKGDVYQAQVIATSTDGSSSSATFEINVVGNAVATPIDIDDSTEFARQNLVSEKCASWNCCWYSSVCRRGCRGYSVLLFERYRPSCWLICNRRD